MAKILMVDDDAEFLEASKTLLEANGYAVTVSSNAGNAIAVINSVKPDIIFLDIMMETPDDGIVLANKIRKEGIKTPIVMLSGVGKVTGYEYGKCDEVLPCNDFLEKPVSPKDLLNKVKNILKK